MTNNSDGRNLVSKKSAYATLQPGDRPTESKLVLLFRNLKQQGVTRSPQNQYKQL